MEPSFSPDGDLEHRLPRDVGSKLRRYRQASPAQRREAYLHIIDQLGRDRTARWSRWAEAVGRALVEAGQEDEPSSGPVPPPPDPPSSLVDDIVVLRNELGRQLLSTWAYLGRVALEGSVRSN